MFKMKVAIISCFETYQNRIDDMERYYQSKGFDVTIIKSNFLHFKKNILSHNKKKDNEILVQVPKYKKNISIRRIFSHYKFSKNCTRYLEENKYDLLHVLIPPNYLCKAISELTYKPKIIYDVIDYWPETMPVNKISNLSIYKKWQELRNRYIIKSDYIITECDLFRDKLCETTPINKIRTIYFTRKEEYNLPVYKPHENRIDLVYLGSINNIIDIDLIVTILIQVDKMKKVNFHIIGDGERKVELINLLEENEISFIDHGVIYKTDEKNKIFDKCAFAFNVMKPNVFVGLTMKSLDYFQSCVPIINNIDYDTKKIVSNYKVGLNISDYQTVDELANEIVTNSMYHTCMGLRNNVKKMFKKKFAFEELEKKMNLVVNKIV